MSGEVVKYKNELNKFSFTGLTETDINLVFAIFQRFKEKQTDKIKISGDELKELIDYRTKKLSFENYALNAVSKLQKFTIKRTLNNEKSGESFALVTVFPVIELLDYKNFVFHISPYIVDWVNEIENNFTRFELAEFVNLSGGYAKTLYRLLKQYRSTGWAKFDWEEFKHLMNVPQGYLQHHIDKRILNPAIEELMKSQDLFDTKRQPFTNLKYEKIKGKGRGRGGKVIGIQFTFDPLVDPDDPEETLTLEKLVGTEPQRVGDAVK